VFNQKRHLAKCFALPTREPEAYYRPDRKRVTPYVADVVVLGEHDKELQELKASGVPPYLARVMVLVAYAHTKPDLEKRVREAAKR
jgi:N-methylhydantoinase A/oxoprolinase/acetone carboxylase beta subunit